MTDKHDVEKMESQGAGATQFSRQSAMPSALAMMPQQNFRPPEPTKASSTTTTAEEDNENNKDKVVHENNSNNDNAIVNDSDLQSLRKWMDIAYKTDDYEAVITISRLLIQHRENSKLDKIKIMEDNNNAESAHDKVQIFVKLVDLSTLSLYINPRKETIGDLKKQIYEKSVLSASSSNNNEVVIPNQKESDSYLRPERQRLAFFGSILDDNERTLASYGKVEDGVTIHVVKRLRGGAAAGEDGMVGAALPTQLLQEENKQNTNKAKEDKIQIKKKLLQEKMKKIQYRGAALPTGLLNDDDDDNNTTTSAATSAAVNSDSVVLAKGAALPSGLLHNEEEEEEDGDYNNYKSNTSSSSSSTVKQRYIQIYLESARTGEKTIMQLNSESATISDIQTKIFATDCILPYAQQLFLKGGKKIPTHSNRDGKTLVVDHNIREGSTVIWTIDQKYTYATSDGKIDIIIKSLRHKAFHMQVNCNETTVKQLKEMIGTKKSIPTNSQRLIYTGKLLENNKLLSDYTIESWSTIHVIAATKEGGPFKWGEGEELEEGIDQNTIIKNNTSDDKSMQSISSDEQSLAAFPTALLGGRQDREEKIIKIHFKKDKSQNNLCTLDVNLKTDTIEVLQAKLYQKVGIPPYSQKLTMLGSGDDIPTDPSSQDLLVSDCGIQEDGSTIICSTHSVNIEGKLTFTLKTLTGKLIPFTFDSHNITVETVKASIEEREGIPVDQQRLVFVGELLADDKMMSNYRIPSLSILFLVLRLRGGAALPSTLLNDGVKESSEGPGRAPLPSSYGVTTFTKDNNYKSPDNIGVSGDELKFTVKTLKGTSIPISVQSRKVSIQTVKEIIMNKDGIPVDKQRLIFNAQQLENHKLLSDYNVKAGSILHLVLGVRGGMPMPKDDNELNFTVKTLTGKSIPISVPSHNVSVETVKEIVMEKEGVPIDQQRLILYGKQLEDKKKLSDYDVKAGSLMHLVLRLRGATVHFNNKNKEKTLSLFGLDSVQEIQEINSIYVTYKRRANGACNVTKEAVKEKASGSQVVHKIYPDINVARSAEEYLPKCFNDDDINLHSPVLPDNVKCIALGIKWSIRSREVHISQSVELDSGDKTAQEISFNSMDSFWENSETAEMSSSPSTSVDQDVEDAPLPSHEPMMVGAPLPTPDDHDPTPRPVQIPASPMPTQMPMPMPTPPPYNDDNIPPPPVPPPPVPLPPPDPAGAAMPDRNLLTCCKCVSLVCLARLIPRWDLESAKEQHRNRQPMNGKERTEAWSEYIENHPDVGVFTLAYMHSGSTNGIMAFFVRFLLVSLVAVQLIIPILVTYNEAGQYYSDEEGSPLYCPSTADPVTRTLAVTIGIIYLGKLTFICLQKFTDSDNSPVLVESEYGGKIQLAIAVDRWMHLVYEPAIYLLNLWLVYITPEPLDMVLNALAMEFILQLDDELKPLYLATFEPDIDLYKDENNENGNKQIGRRQYVLVVLSSLLSLWSMISICILIYAATLYLPICKPG